MDTAKNKSSILKPQKPRNPLSDLDFIEPVKVESPGTTTSRRVSLRRVSFASSNFVKEFAIDPEANTILWDTTYEEMINKSDSTNSSEVPHKPSNVSSGKESLPTMITNSEKNKVIMNPNPSSECGNNISLVNPETCIKTDNRKISINFNEEGGEDIQADSSLCNIDNCESRIIETGNVKSSTSVNPMITQQIVGMEQLSTKNLDFNLTDLQNCNKSPVLPSNILNVPSVQSQNLICANKENIPTQSGSHIIVPTFNQRRLCQPTTTVHDHGSTFSSKKNVTIVTDENMEFTQQFPVVRNSSNAGNKTVMMEETLEFTRPLTAFDCMNFNVNKTRENRSFVGAENMEFTQELPLIKSSSKEGNKTVMMEESLEFTQPFTAFESITINHKKDRTGDENRSYIGDENMDFTQHLPIVTNICNPRNKTIIMEEDIEFTRPLQGFGALAVNVNSNIESDGNRDFVGSENMEFTQQLPIIKNICNSKNKTIKLEADLECTQPPLAFEALALNVNSNKETCFKDDRNKSVDENMKLIQQLPVKNSSNPGNKSINIKDGIGFTQPLSAFDALTIDANKGSNLLVKSDKNNTVLDDDDMEITQEFLVNESFVQKNQSIMMGTTPEYPVHKTLISDKNNELLIKDVDNANKESNDGSQIRTNCSRQNTNESEILNVSSAVSEQFPIVNNCLPSADGNACLSADMEKSIKIVEENVKNEETNESCKEIFINKQNTSCSGFKTPEPSLHSYTPFSPGIDDTQHLINCSISSKPSKSDFSKIITGDLNPSFLCSKFMHLSEFSINAFPVSLETSRNQTHVEPDKVDFPMSNVVSHEELDKTKNSALSVSTETAHDNEIHSKKEDKNCDAVPDATTNISNKTHLEQMHLCKDKNCETCSKDTKCEVSVSETDVTDSGEPIRKKIGTLKRHSLEDIESFTTSKKLMLDIPKNDDVNIINNDEHMEMSFITNNTGNISQENLTLCDSVASTNNTLPTDAKELIMNITQSIVHASMSQDSTKNKDTCTNKISINQKLEEFMERMRAYAAEMTKNTIIFDELCDEELKEISRPFKQHSFDEVKYITDSSSTECSLVEPITDSTDVEQELHFRTGSEMDNGSETILTLKQKIEEKQKRCKGYWDAICIKDDEYKFITLYKTIHLTVEFNKETGIVNKSDICSKILDDSEPIGLFVHKIFKDRLSQKNIQSAVGEQYDILTLLDYLYLNMQKMLEFLNEFNSFVKRFNMKMDHNFRVTFKIVNMILCSTWYISVDLSNMENISQDSVTAYAKFGTVNETEIKSFVTGCPPGLLFLKSFIKNVVGYVTLLANRKNLVKSKAIDLT